MLSKDSPKLTQSKSSQSAGNASVCIACNKSHPAKDLILCHSCCACYDFLCAGFPRTLTEEIRKDRKKEPQRLLWQCTKCIASKRRSSSIRRPSSGSTPVPPPLSTESLQNQIDQHIQSTLDTIVKKVDETCDKLIRDLLARHTADINNQMTELKGVIESVQSKVSKLESHMQAMKTKRVSPENENILTKVADLESRVHSVESRRPDQTQAGANMDDRLKNFIVYGVPNETEVPVTEIVNKICRKYDVGFTAGAVNCFRLNQQNDAAISTPILCKFSSKEKRDEVFFNYIKKRDLCIGDVVDAAGADYRLYINEHLTKEEASIVRKCRQLKREEKIFKFYIRNSRISVALTSTKRSAVHVASMSDLDKLVEGTGVQQTDGSLK